MARQTGMEMIMNPKDVLKRVVNRLLAEGQQPIAGLCRHGQPFPDAELWAEIRADDRADPLPATMRRDDCGCVVAHAPEGR